MIEAENNDDQGQPSRALELKYSIGYNSAMTNAVHNLTLPKKEKNKLIKEIFYPAANTGVIYNYGTGESKLLQGHCNAITAVNTIYCEKYNKRLIVTADSGKNAAILIWNADTYEVENSIFRPETDEVVSIAFTTNCLYIGFLAHQKNKKGEVVSQKIFIFDIKLDDRAQGKDKEECEQIYYTEFGCEDGEIYYDLKFNPNLDTVMEFLVTSPNKIFFSVLSDNENSRAYYPHPIEAKPITEKKNQVNFTQSIFLNNNDKGNTAITGTTGGYIIVWDVCEALCKEDEVKTDRRKIKTVDLLGKYKKDKDKKGWNSDKDHINILVNYKNYIVIGSGGGTVNFYDYSFIIVRWFENICWMIKSISFDMVTDDDNSWENRIDNNVDDTGNTSNFVCAPFIVSDISAVVKRVYSTGGEHAPSIDVSDDTLKYEEIYRGIESEVTCIAVHPKLRKIAIGTRGLPPKNLNRKTNERQKDAILKEKKFEYRAYVQIFNYPDHMDAIKKENQRKEEEDLKKKDLKNAQQKDKKKNSPLYPGKSENGKANKKTESDEGNENHYTNKSKRYFTSDAYPTAMEFSTCGDDTLMVGTAVQKIYPLNINNLSGQLPEKQTLLQIKEIADKEDKKAEIKEIIFSPDQKHFAASDTLGRIGVFRIDNRVWSLEARYHFRDEVKIISFCFNEDGQKIFTITSDRCLEEFSLEKDQKYKNLTLNKPNSLQVEDDCELTSIVSYPLAQGKEKTILISNNQFKLRIANVFDIPTIIKTVLGPCFGGPIATMKVIPGNHKDKRLIAFTTKEKIMGLISLPLDGNPFKYMGVIAHPGTIVDMKTAQNFNHIFTTGGNDYTINIWKYDVNPMIEMVKSGGNGIKPFLELLEGGDKGSKYKEMVDYFYYAQIKSKDENTTKHRILDQTVSLSTMGGLLSSLGFYPSKRELQNIDKEVKHGKKYAEGAKDKNDDIDFDTFVKIYLNYRPYIELDVEKIEGSFNNMIINSQNKEGEDKFVKIKKRDLINYLISIKIDEKSIKRITDNFEKDLSKNSNLTKEHKEITIKKGDFMDTLKENNTLDEKQVSELILSLTKNPPERLTNIIYEINDKLISRDTFINLLKSYGEVMDDKEISEILKTLVGDPDVTHLPPMLSFDYVFENILFMEREEKEVIQ